MVKRASAFAVLALLWGCSLAAVDLTGKACPCPNGWSCVDGACVEGTVDGGPSASCGSPGAYRLEGLESGWRTERSLQWKWRTAPDADGADLLHYTLVVGTNAERVEACACALGRGDSCEESDTLRALDETDNPELAYDTRSNHTGGREPVRSTVSADLEPDVVYTAVLLAFDTSGGVSRTPTAFNRTGRLTDEALTVFDRGTIDSGYTIPGCFDTSMDGYAYEVSCPPPPGERGGCKTMEDPCPEDSQWPGEDIDDWLCETDVHPDHRSTCWITLRWQDLTLPIGERLPEGAFDDAFVEVVLALDGEPSNYGELFIVLEDDAGEPSSWGLRTGELALRAGGTERVYRVPLQVLTREDGPQLEWTDMQGRILERVSVGALFSHGSSIDVKSVVVRY